MQKHEFVVQLKRNSVVRSHYILESVKEDVMGILVVSDLLLLLRDIDSNLDGLGGVS